ncbi:hypothetical protein KAI92_04700 [Candidatus Parcubacteria bacterium]|nr:hypothetical protein [Candidatus Parcubacteria bacterium]
MINKLLEKIEEKWLFLIIVFLMYFVLWLVDSVKFLEVLYYFLNLLKEIIPVLFLVFFLMFISSMIFSSKRVEKLFGKDAGIISWLAAIIGGILSAGPIYVWYPMLSDFKEKGMRNCFITIFLYNRAIKIPLLPIMILYFDVQLIIILTIYMIIFSVINGIIVEKILKLNN